MSKSFNKTINGGKFNEVFTEVPHAETLGLKNPEQLRLFHLNVNNNAFSSDQLEVFLRKNIGQYVFSRAQIENYRIEDDVFSVGLDAIEIMKRNGAPGKKGTGNDLGEILLYIFLEQVLGAPKILSKVELQTGAKQFDSKCDGIHLLSLEQTFGMPYYHMVFGTSSIVGDMKKAVDSAFDAIVEIEKQSTQERTIAENTVFSKSFDQDTIQRIKDLLVPSKGPKVPCDTAYGVFLAYNLGLKAANYSGVDFRRALTQKMDTDIRNHASYIASKINVLGLGMHSFYFYILPLNDADAEKAQIMDRVMNGGGRP